VTRRRWAAWALGAGTVVLVGGWAAWPPDDAPGRTQALADAAPAGATSAASTPRPVGTARPGPPDGQEVRALWQQRLERSRQVYDQYRHATRYPPESRPINEHPDQKYPNRPIEEERPLRLPGTPAREGVMLRTTQERVFVQGDETVLLTVEAHDSQGQRLPLQVQRAFAHEGGTGARPSSVAPRDVEFRDDGRGGDLLADDGVLSLRLQPASQGFADLSGLIRVEAALQSGDQPGFVYFDIVYSPSVPATWVPGVREAVENGSLNLYLRAEVKQPGRYVVSGRLDDTDGRPFALARFNEELATGPREIRLQVFGKLLRDGQPHFPLTLRDVDGFLLRPDAFPDRALMPRLPGTVHVTRLYASARFSDAEWASAERDRYLAEYGKDLKQAEDEVDRLTKEGP
jgi:hypothetical protein